MATGRRRHSSEFKAKVALEALKGQKTLNELASEYGVHPVQIAQWKRQAQEGLAGVFESPKSRHERVDEALIEQLYQEIGQLKVELDWLRKKGRPLPRRDRSGGG
jgi:transposase-like protein